MQNFNLADKDKNGYKETVNTLTFTYDIAGCDVRQIFYSSHGTATEKSYSSHKYDY